MAASGHYGHNSSSYAKESQAYNILFDERSTSPFSQTFTTFGRTHIIQAWGLEDGDTLCLQQAIGEYEGERFEPFSLEPGKVAMLTKCHNALPVVVEGRFRLFAKSKDPTNPPQGRIVVTVRENTTGEDLSGFQMFSPCCPASDEPALPNMHGAGAPGAAPDLTAEQPVYVDTGPDGQVYINAAGAWFAINAGVHWMSAPRV